MTALTPAMELVMALSALQGKLLKRIDQRLSTHGISYTELMVLHYLAAAPGQTLRRLDLAECVGLSASGVTRVLAPMEKIKLVVKEANPRDARVSLVKLSKPGAQVYRDAMVTFEESAGSLLQGLMPAQLADFLALALAVRAA